MKELFEKYAPWKILHHLALNSGRDFHVKELARILNMSPGTCSVLLRNFETDGILKSKKLGTGHFYRYEDNFLTREIKRFIGMSWIFDSGLVQEFLEQSSFINSIALFGSYSDGDFTEKSDIDILVLASNKFSINVEGLESKMGRNINVEILTNGQWLSMKKKNDAFYISVIGNHVLVYGGELP